MSSSLFPIRPKRVIWFGLVLVGLLTAGHPKANAVTIAWGTSLVETFVDSDGSNLSGSFTAYLGYFDSIVPSSDNLISWTSDFEVFDSTSVVVGAADGFTSSAHLFADGSSDGTGASASTAFPGKQAYVWIRNQTVVDTNMEWALYTDSSWIFPSGSDTHDPGNDVNWFLSAPPDTDVFGVTNYPGSGYPPTDSPEQRTDPGSPVSIQTATIPEPSSVALLLVAGGLLLMNRRKD